MRCDQAARRVGLGTRPAIADRAKDRRTACGGSAGRLAASGAPIVRDTVSPRLAMGSMRVASAPAISRSSDRRAGMGTAFDQSTSGNMPRCLRRVGYGGSVDGRMSPSASASAARRASSTRMGPSGTEDNGGSGALRPRANNENIAGFLQNRIGFGGNRDDQALSGSAKASNRSAVRRAAIGWGGECPGSSKSPFLPPSVRVEVGALYSRNR